jgi:LysM repeat protein
MRRLVILGIWILPIAACSPLRVVPTPTPTLTSMHAQTPTPAPSSTPTPVSTPTCAPTIYTVEQGDTLGDIATLHGTTAGAICAFNELEDCGLIYPGQELLIPCEGVTATMPSPSPTPTHTPTPTPLLTPTPTNTRVVPLPTATPNFTPTPTYEFVYEEGSMQTAPDCSTVHLKIKVVDAGGEPVNDVAVRLQWAGFTHTKITGRGEAGQPLGGEPDGEVGFSPLGSDHYHLPIDFHIQLVQSPSDPTPRSNEKVVHFADCATAGAFTNTKFVRQW